MAMTISNGNKAQAEINMIPLIDILLVLLIIFMVITPIRSVGLDALIPQEPDTPIVNRADHRAVVVQIDRDLALRINHEAVSESQLAARLMDIFKTRAERVIFVQADADVEFQHVARAMDVARNAGIDKVGLLGTMDSTPAI